jgi:hypothetical protein
MNTSKGKVFFILCLLTAPLVGIAWTQSRGPKLPIATPTPQTDFKAEQNKRLQSKKEMQAEFDKELGKHPKEKVIVADEDPGTSGLVWVGTARKSVAVKPVVDTLTYSELKTLGTYRKKPGTYIVAGFNSLSESEEQYFFSPYSTTDVGYITDPLWLNNDRTLVMKCGVYGDVSQYTVYVFDKPTKRLFRLTEGLVNPRFTVSPGRRYLTYILGGNSSGPGSMMGGEEPVGLWVWDAKLNHKSEVATNLRLQGSYWWKSKHELIYSQEEKRGVLQVPVSYIWDAVTDKKQFFLLDCQSPVISPDGQYVVYATSLDPTKSFTPDNSTYVVRNLKSGKKTVIERTGLGKYDPNRQVMWSADSRLIFSMSNLWTQQGQKPYRLFVYNRVSGKALSWSFLKPEVHAILLNSSMRGDRVFFLQQRILTKKLTVLKDFDYGFSVESVNTKTGKVTTLIDKKHILGLSDASIGLRKEFLKD